MSGDIKSRNETTQNNEMLLRLITHDAYRIIKTGLRYFGMISTRLFYWNVFQDQINMKIKNSVTNGAI